METMRKNRLDIRGQKFGKLTALYPTERKNTSGSIVWRCRCDCGNEVDVSVAELRKGNNKSCGCLKEASQKMVHDRLQLVDGTCVEWLGGRKMRRDNQSGSIGIQKRKNGKYIANIGFKKKLLYLGTFDNYEEAVYARQHSEQMIYEGFRNAYDLWKEKAEDNPAWAELNPFIFDVRKENGALTIENSMSEYMRKTNVSAAI